MSDLTPAGFVRDLELIGAEVRTDEAGITRARCPACCSDKPVLLIDQRDGLRIACTGRGCDDIEVVNAVEKLKARSAKLTPTPPPPGRFLSEVPIPGPVKWFWPPRVPAGALSSFEGDSEKFKTTVIRDLAARNTTGRPMPLTGEKREPAGVVWAGYEEASSISRGGLEAAGADVSRVLDLSTVLSSSGERPLSLPKDIPILEAGIARAQANLVVIDPIMAALDGGTDSHSDASVRRALTPLSALAERTGAAIIFVRHWGKDRTKGAAHRGGGSVAFTAAARAVWAFMADPDEDGRFIMARAKCNLARNPPGVIFKAVDHNGYPTVEYVGLEPRHADAIIERKQTDKAKEALAWLRTTLQAGPLPSEEVLKRGQFAGYSRNLLFTVKAEAGVRARKAGMAGGWTWEVEEDAPHA